MREYPPLAVDVVTPVLTLRGASEDLLAEPAPFDHPMSLYEDDPERRLFGLPGSRSALGM